MIKLYGVLHAVPCSPGFPILDRHTSGFFQPQSLPFLYSHSHLVSMETLPEPQPPSQGKNMSTLTQAVDHNFQRLERLEDFLPLNIAMSVIFQKKFHSPTALS